MPPSVCSLCSAILATQESASSIHLMRPGSPADRLGPYILRESLGQGPTGAVYRATKGEHGIEIALKVVVLRPDSEPDSLLRDLTATNTIHVGTALRHPGIVPVYSVDAIAGTTATEMEYVRGMSLRDLLGIAGRLLPERSLALISQILDALAYAHARRAVHGDLKPTNILIRNDGLVKLSDFGYRDVCADPTSVYTARIHSYSAPEELDMDATTDRRGDIWSVGVLLFQMLTGRLPFPISDLHDLRAWQRGLRAQQAAPLRTYLPDAPLELEQALARALQYAPDARFASARDFLNALMATGLCAGLIESEEDDEDRQEATYKRIDNRLREEVKADEDTTLPELVRALSISKPDFEDSDHLLHYAGVLEKKEREGDDPEPHAIALTREEVDHLEEIETRLRSLLAPTEADESDQPTLQPLSDKTASLAKDIFPLRPWERTTSIFDTSEPGAIAKTVIELTESENLSLQKSRFETLYNPTDGAELVFVPAGEFIMGSNGYSEDNAPERTVMLDGFCIYRYPVTVAQYRHYCEENAYPMPHAYWPWEDKDPIVGVTWHEACAYCEWVDAKLPTEAQWEKAARGVDGRTYPWGDHFDQRSDHRLTPKSPGKTTSVGSYPSGASPYGMMDVVGNIQQWCLDLYDDQYYKTSPLENPPGPAASAKRRTTKSGLVQKLFNKNMPPTSQTTERRVVRGSSWKDFHESFAYVFRRETLAPDLRLPWVGFRCVASFVPERANS